MNEQDTTWQEIVVVAKMPQFVAGMALPGLGRHRYFFPALLGLYPEFGSNIAAGRPSL